MNNTDYNFCSNTGSIFEIKEACNLILNDLPIQRIRRNIGKELEMMSEKLGVSLTEEPLSHILSLSDDLLNHITHLFINKEIDPFANISISSKENFQNSQEGAVRIGIYPVSANPLHWGHLLIGLSAIALYKLDRVVYIIAADDIRKPDLIPAEIRHMLSRKMLEMFYPLFLYSDIALGSNIEGEVNAFRLLSFNRNRKVHACYLVGTDHYRRFDANGRLDTIGKIEKGIENRIYSFQRDKHEISIVFIKREGKETESLIPTRLNVNFLESLPFNVSSTMIRKSFQGQYSKKIISLLTYSIYMWSKTLSLYNTDINYKKINKELIKTLFSVNKKAKK